MSRQTRALIHRDALVHNFTSLSELAPDSQTMAVIKADAYGHGAVSVAKVLEGYSPRFAVAITEEAITLREAGITAPVVVLEGPHQEKECQVAAEQNCILVCHNVQQLEWARNAHHKPAVWIKVDSGMHRLGFAVQDVPNVVSAFTDVITSESVLVTHLACADDTSNAFSSRQLNEFDSVRKQLAMPASIANSPATIAWEASRADWNRVGIALYGGEPMSSQIENKLQLLPAMTLQSAVIALRKVPNGDTVGYGQTWRAERDSLIATVGIGYADGYPRHCPNGTPVAVNGKLCELVGRVSMDMITVDVTDIGVVKPGDPVELWGEQVSINDVANKAGTISYELMTRVSPRVPRVLV